MRFVVNQFYQNVLLEMFHFENPCKSDLFGGHLSNILVYYYLIRQISLEVNQSLVDLSGFEQIYLDLFILCKTSIFQMITLFFSYFVPG